MLSTWQDWVLFAVSFIFCVALWPSIKSKTQKPPVSTSLLTGVMLIVTALVELTLALWLSAASTALGGVMWLVLAVQVWGRHAYTETPAPTPDKCAFCDAEAVEEPPIKLDWAMCEYHWAEYWLIVG